MELVERPRSVAAKDASQVRAKVGIEGPRPQGKDLSWRSNKVLRVFLRSFPIRFGGFSPSLKLFFSALREARRDVFH